MIDVHDVIRDYLLTVSGVTDLVGTRIYAGRDVPPSSFSLVDDGACIAFRVRGGDEDYEGALLTPSVQFKCYGQTDLEANTVYRALDDALQVQHLMPDPGQYAADLAVASLGERDLQLSALGMSMLHLDRCYFRHAIRHADPAAELPQHLGGRAPRDPRRSP